MTRSLYDAIATEIKAPALAALAEVLQPVAADIRLSYGKEPETWCHGPQFAWGVPIRNLLRKQGYDEKYFGVPNLDDIYVFLVEDALKLH